MRLSIRLFAVLRERAGRDSIELEDVPEGTTIAQLKELLASFAPELGDLSSASGVVGTAYAAPETVLRPNDEIAFLPPVSGGMPTGDEELSRGVFELSAEPIDLGEIQRRVGHPSCGAIVLFTGTTRDTNRGHEVVQLDYEAFDAMAGPEMERIFGNCLERFGPASGEAEASAASGGAEALHLRMICVHRTGVVGVGDPSVAIAVASPHRDAAFRAARFLIDTLKARLPVWKKEVYSGGHHWIGDRS